MAAVRKRILNEMVHRPNPIWQLRWENKTENEREAGIRKDEVAKAEGKKCKKIPKTVQKSMRLAPLKR